MTRKITVYTILALMAIATLQIYTPLSAQSSQTGTEAAEASAEQKSAESVEKNRPAPPETSDNSLFETVKQGGVIMIPLVLLALIAGTIVIERAIFFLKSKSARPATLGNYLEKAASESNAIYHEELEDDLRNSAQIYTNRMEKGLALLNGIGNVAPILGFFGTVVGMIDAFAAIAAATTVNAKVVAVGIQIALVTTAGGLAVAVPTLAFYHFFVHLVQRIYAHTDTLVEKLTAGKPRMSSDITETES